MLQLFHHQFTLIYNSVYGLMENLSTNVKSAYKSTHLQYIIFYFLFIIISIFLLGGACGVMVIITGNEHGNTSSNPG